jgi:sarcosine oxidase subunit beta
MKTIFDAVIIGAGSVGVPLSLSLSKAGLKVLVIEARASVGQGSNKTAIGGIRATHSNEAKMRLCQQSISVFSEWEKIYGDKIEWERGGYVFLAHTLPDKAALKEIAYQQKKNGLNITYLGKESLLEIVPDLNQENLLGGTYSPEDGYASPLLAIHSMYKHAKRAGAVFKFSEIVEKSIHSDNRIMGLSTNKSTYHSKYVINAAGAWASNIFPELNFDLRVEPEPHEAGITEPVKRFVRPLVVDIRIKPDSQSFYFAQHATGQILFCLTPNPPIRGFDTGETSGFLPLSAARFAEIMPRVSSIRVRRTWRGLYPVTPDGNPFIGESKILDGYLLAAGMCGQGFMLGPGTADLLSRLMLNNLGDMDTRILAQLSIDRKITSKEILK